jgi:hypothetical protein
MDNEENSIDVVAGKFYPFFRTILPMQILLTVQLD